MSGDFENIVDQTIDALEDEGFGVLCNIDVQATLKQKLDADFRQYRILGACNPEQAHQGLQDELLLGTLLPCNVVVYETDDGDVGVSAIDPGQLVSVTDNEALESIAADVHQSFERVLDEVEG
ncbi:DUF302 domain-containing protein [Halorussus sp. MSC15.2]|uniref:DUF302 domain-containing protein n=1 Tax=Halorussus sp. MSC15.2 TaxID=2283638 RepID=UPI0013D5F0A4|nr:DUF302 domain-containing protein [Halorussus sp. MSC15.2]NEU58698.1 DUF302 domain-containing protein [Halorussus sp. MSC15.2]